METQTKPRPLQAQSEAEKASIYVQDDVLEELWFNARWRTDRMAVGILVGKVSITHVQWMVLSTRKWRVLSLAHTSLRSRI